MCKPISSPDAVANVAARWESSIKTIALAALTRLAAKHAMIRSVAAAQRPRSSAFTVSIGLAEKPKVRGHGPISHPGARGEVTRSITACGFQRCNCADRSHERLRATRV